MRILIAIALSILVLPACADMDPYTRWLSSKPLTRLDWMVVNGTKRLTEELVTPGPDSLPFIQTMRAQSVTPTNALLMFDPKANVISLWFMGETKAAKPDSGDCVKALGTVRNSLLIVGHRGGGSLDLKSMEAREKMAAGAMDYVVSLPANIEYPDVPKNMAYALAAITKVRVMLFGADFQGVTSCTGTLAGSDFRDGSVGN